MFQKIKEFIFGPAAAKKEIIAPIDSVYTAIDGTTIVAPVQNTVPVVKAIDITDVKAKPVRKPRAPKVVPAPVVEVAVVATKKKTQEKKVPVPAAVVKKAAKLESVAAIVPVKKSKSKKI